MTSTDAGALQDVPRNVREDFPRVDDGGLSARDVEERREKGLINHVRDTTSRSFADIVRSNVFTLFNAIILTAMVLVLIAGSWKDAVFGVVIIVNTGIGIIVETKSKRTLDRLSILVAADFVVRRDGHDTTVSHDGIVLDDLLWIRSGDQVPADAVVVRSWGLELDESMLTGESRTVRKTEGDPVYSGSAAVSGIALTRVTAVGEDGYAAKLTAQAKVYRRTVSDLSRGINTILRYMTIVVIPLCALLAWSQIKAVGGWENAVDTGQWRSAVVSSVAGVVGMIPEGLVLLVSLNFAIAAMRLAREKTLVQELESVETLARVDCLNLDKTGTITDGTITMRNLVAIGDGRVGDDVRQAVFDLANEENPNATGQAIVSALSNEGVGAGDVLSRVPFSSGRKWSSVVNGDGTWFLGAPEVILSALHGAYADVSEEVDGLAAGGDRVLLVVRSTDGSSVVASGSASDGAFEVALPSTAIPMALVVCSERIRDDAESTLAWFREQGVRCRLISGDNPATVGSIAARVGLTGKKPPRVMDARTLPADIAQLSDVLEDVDVLGRVLPEQKKSIVEALHRSGHVVAMTGDGVNDTLALKEADLGVAMGNAAPAAKAVAQLVLVDSRFSHLPDVVARGRQVMANMERVAALFLTKTVYSSLIAFVVVLTRIPFPYLPRHITYVGALTIGIPAFILALAPNTRRYVPGFLTRVIRFAFPGGLAIALSVMLSAWILPSAMGWDLGRPSDLAELRSSCAMILFVMGIAVLAKVASPLRSWRGALVAFFAAAGVCGILIEPVASFFALRFPAWRMMLAVLVAIAASCVIFVIIHWLEPVVERLIDRVRHAVMR
ncbi:HAD-IC family P-type ATPase [uncultured Bifidobacterium sp.]|uniref:HAD-IC family P-type ATPase n=1 Tax=uncultured Bifidobacterium sp. TaxID=165187 RepID=UPI002622B31E|nr:HAD-IC family P-type ATPase [uncultured Bifidobacterium sp.]